MGGAEGVIDVELGKLCELLGKILIILFFFSVEAEIFKQQSLAFLELERHFFGFGPDALGAEADVFAARQFLVEHHAETLGDGFETQLWICLAFGTTSDGKPYSVDSVSAGGTAAGAFPDRNVGTAKAVTVTGVTVTGTGNGNYTATQQTGLTADITQKAL